MGLVGAARPNDLMSFNCKVLLIDFYMFHAKEDEELSRLLTASVARL